MFRRDKDSRIDNEGLRRMREAIRQRADHEGEPLVDQDEAEEPTYRSSLLSTPLGDSYGSIQPFDAGTTETEFSWARTDRGVTPVEAPIPSRAEEPTWSVADQRQRPALPAHTTVAADTVWRGTLRSSTAIRIEGTFEGEIDTDQELQITAEAKVDATVRARTVMVAGQLNGRIECLERLEILASGRVTGQIEAGRFVVHEGAFLGGQVRMKGTAQGTQAGDDDTPRPLLQRVR